MDIGDDVVLVKTDRLGRVCDFNATGYFVQLYGSDGKTFVRKHEVRRAERSDIIRLQARDRQRMLTPGPRELDPIQALLAAQSRKRTTPLQAAPATDAIERFLRDET